MKDWPVYFKDKLIVGNLDSNVGIATLWMPKEAVAGDLKPDMYSVCGQLYTKRGINPLFRNILANPNIRYLVVCGIDRQGSGESLKRFFEKGLSNLDTGYKEGWRIADDDEALIDKEIHIDALESIRKNVKFIDMRMKPTSEILKIVSGLEKLPPFGKPCLFDEPKKSDVVLYPSDLSVFKIRRDYIGDAWIDVLKNVMHFGIEIPGMYGKAKEVHNMAVVIEKEDPENPKFYDYFKFGSEGLNKYYEGFFDINAEKSEAYTYGERIKNWSDTLNQYEIMEEKLKRNPYDKGVISVLWQPEKDNYPPKNVPVSKSGQTPGWRVPCLVMILSQCLGEYLHMTAVFRNNDMYGAWPLNAFALRKMQKKLAESIGKNLGSLTTISHISEIYEIDWDDTSNILSKYDNLDRTCSYDPRGYYVVRVEGSDILLTFFNPDGSKEIASYKFDGKKPKVARDACAHVIKDLLISEIGAAMDLGRQLAKAETAVKLGLVFEQDQPLKVP